ncbi:hypothetical protein BC830DRAFT_662905 [Chytriomyces sp. MP71]|nr:hypothetical protein BC830DRAFT_662905 [Chytriomyces sp. MP71]
MENGHRVYVVAPSEDAAVWYSACDLCKRSKRGCDRLLPSCTRCLHVGVECRYRDQKRDPRPDHHRDPRHAQPAATRTAMALDELRNAIAAQQNTAGFELAAALALAARIAQLHTGLMQVAACIPSPLDPSIPIPQQHILQQKPSQGQSSASVTTVNSLLPQQAPAFPFSAQSTPSPYASSSQNPENYHAEWVMEDPDLMPTGEDWFLCHRYITPVVSLGSLLDPQSFLESFFREPPELRLSFCAIAAHCSSPRLPDATCNAYYMRARKAISRSMQHHPTVKTVQSLEMLSSFAFSSGQPLVGNRYFFSAVKLSLALRLNEDPDSLIECIQLTEVEREDRRLTFWVIYYTLKMIQIVNGKPLPVTIPTHNVKPAKEFRANSKVAFQQHSSSTTPLLPSQSSRARSKAPSSSWTPSSPRSTSTRVFVPSTARNFTLRISWTSRAHPRCAIRVTSASCSRRSSRVSLPRAPSRNWRAGCCCGRPLWPRGAPAWRSFGGASGRNMRLPVLPSLRRRWFCGLRQRGRARCGGVWSRRV